MEQAIHNEDELEHVLRTVVVPIYDAMKADPSRALSAEQMQSTLVEWDVEDGAAKEPAREYLKRSA